MSSNSVSTGTNHVVLKLKDLAPEVVRKRLLIEGIYFGDMTADRVRHFLLDVAERLGMRTYGEPVVYSPASGMGRDQNAGFDAFVPLIDSGISAYFWSGPRFFSVLIYTCKDFDSATAVEIARELLDVREEVVTHAF
jgi:S-adenosylmethionine decarboxylase